MPLRIHPADLERVELCAAAAYPEECCGLLLGRVGEDGAVQVGRVEPCVNRAPEPRRRFTISPEALLAAHRRARRRGERVVGTFHSHPGGAAVPSVHDRASAWPGASYLIVGWGAEGVGERRSWRFAAERFAEQTLEVGRPGRARR